MKFRPLIFFVFILIFSCNKENTDLMNCDCDPIDSLNNDEEIIDSVIRLDTFKIGEYFPVYPNSKWVYLNQLGDTVKYMTSLNYEKCTLYQWYTDKIDTVFYATRYNGFIVNKYEILEGSSSYHESPWKRILPDNLVLNKYFEEDYRYPSTYYRGKIIAKDTTFLNFNSVIFVNEYIGPESGNISIGKTYYAKNIGIIRTEQWYAGEDSIRAFEELIDYKIGQ
ncbi:MAG: hypothetical protein R2757_20330 [Draconibacterium sp.]